MSEKLLLKKTLFEELKKVNEQLKFPLITDSERRMLQSHKDFIQCIIDICVDRNKF